MRKILLSICISLVTVWAVADVYTYDSGTKTYLYTGEPVKTFNVDFTTWETSALPDKIYDADGATEAGNMAFVKWMLSTRSLYLTSDATNKTSKHIAFNTGTTHDEAPVKNGSSSNKPRIYLPTTANGVKKITAHMAVNKANTERSVAVYYKDEQHTTWYYPSGQTLTFTTSRADEIATVELELNTIGKTSIYLQYGGGEYFSILDIALDIEPIEYAYNETSKRYDYIGEPLEETLVVDFTQLPSYKKAFNTTLGSNVHADTCLEFEHVGLYKWSHNLEDRSCGGVTYPDVLSNYGNSDVNGAKTGNNNAALALKPAIYLPTMKNGISKIIVEGWTNGNGKDKSVFFIGKDVDGTWKNVNVIDPSISTNEITLKGNTYTQETLEINSHQIKTVAIYRSTTEYQFITKITIIPMEGLPEVEIDENEDNETVLETYKNQTVNLIVNRNLKAGVYNTFCLPGEVSGSAFKTAIGDPDCEIRWFDNAAIEGNSLNLTFNVTSKIQAGFPYLVKPSKDIEDPILLENVEIKYTSGRNIARPSETPLVKFFSTLSPMELSVSENYLVLSADNTLYFVDEAVTMPGMRGYFVLYNEAARAVKANKMPMRAIFPNDAPTEMEQIKAQSYEKVIENGQLIIRRDGIKYTIDGRLIK